MPPAIGSMSVAPRSEPPASSPAYALAWAVAVVVLTIMVLRGWARKPEFMRRALWIVPVFLLFALFWATPLELRGMLEIFPVLGILVLPPPPPDPEAAFKAVS